jgi:carbamoyl-phosphate synthase large subunit
MADHLEHDTPLPAYPYILKRRIGGARSNVVYLIMDEEGIAGLLARGASLKDFIAQEYIEGDEYTCGSINFDGKCQGAIVMRRILRDGDTYKCFSVRNTGLEEHVMEIMDAIKPFGACNVQLRIGNGVPYVFEINARCSGTTAARALCGFNEPKMIADFLLQGKRPDYTIKEQTILRYWKELVVENTTVSNLQQDHMLKRSDFTRL